MSSVTYSTRITINNLDGASSWDVIHELEAAVARHIDSNDFGARRAVVKASDGKQISRSRIDEVERLAEATRLGPLDYIDTTTYSSGLSEDWSSIGCAAVAGPFPRGEVRFIAHDRFTLDRVSQEIFEDLDNSPRLAKLAPTREVVLAQTQTTIRDDDWDDDSAPRGSRSAAIEWMATNKILSTVIVGLAIAVGAGLILGFGFGIGR